MLLGYIFTGSLATAISIGGFKVITKLVLYFFHERYWARIRWGVIPGTGVLASAARAELDILNGVAT